MGGIEACQCGNDVEAVSHGDAARSDKFPRDNRIYNNVFYRNMQSAWRTVNILEGRDGVVRNVWMNNIYAGNNPYGSWTGLAYGRRLGNTNRWIAMHYLDAGFDAMIANPFVGWKGGLEVVFDEANSRDKGVILLVYMSHPGAPEGYGRMVMDEQGKRLFYTVFAENARKWGASGVIVGATHLPIVQEVYNILGEEIITLVDQFQTQGNYSILFDASELPSGIYLYELISGQSFVKIKKMTVIK